MALGDLGDLTITVGGDISPLQNALAAVPQAVSGISTQVSDAFAGLGTAAKTSSDALAQLTTSAQASGQAVRGVGISAQSTDDDLKRLSQSVADANGKVTDSVGGWQSLAPAITNAGAAAGQAEGQVSKLGQAIMTGLGVGTGLEILQGLVEGMKELGEAAIGTFSQIERSTLALTALTGSVDTANSQIQHLKDLAVSEALSFPELVQANQRMIAMGFSTTQTTASLQAAANASAATGVSLQIVMNSLERMSEAGSLAGRQLATLGLSMQDVARAEGTTADQAKAMYQSLDPGQRLQVLIDALGKYQGAAQALVVSLSGQFKQLSTEITLALEPIGEAVAPMLKAIMSEIQESALPAIKSLVGAFQELASVVGPIATSVITGLIGNLSDLTTVVSGVVTETLKAGAAFVDWNTGATNLKGRVSDLDLSMGDLVRIISAIGTAGLSEGIHASAVEFHLLNAETDLATEALKRNQQVQHDVVAGIKELIDNTKYESVNLQLIYDDYKQLDAARQAALITLNNTITAYREHNASLGQVKQAQDAYNKALYDMDPAAKTAAEAAKQLADSIQKLIDTSNISLAMMPTTIEEVAHGFEESGKTVKSWSSQIQSEIDNIVKKEYEIGGATTDMLAQYGKLVQARDQLKQLAAEQAWIDIKNKIDDLNKAMQAAGGATSQQLAELDKLKDKLQEAADAATKTGVAVTQLAKDSTGAWHQVIGPIQEADAGIQVINGSMMNAAAQANAAALGITVLTSKTNDNTTATKGASAAQSELGTVFVSTAEKAAAAAQQAQGMAKAMENVAAAAKDAADSMEAALAASDALANSFAVTGFGGGPGGSASGGGTIATKPGDVITQRGESGQIISQYTVPGAVEPLRYNVQSVSGAGSSGSGAGSSSSTGPGSSAAIIKEALDQVNTILAEIAQAQNAGNTTASDMALLQGQLLDAQKALAAILQVPLNQIAANTDPTAFGSTINDLTTATSGLTDATNAVTSAVTSTAVTAIAAIQGTASTVVSGINALIEPIAATVSAAAPVLGANSTTLLGSSAPSIPLLNNAPGASPRTTFTLSNVLQGGGIVQGGGAPFSPNVGPVSVNVNVYGGGQQAAQEFVSTLQSLGVKVV